nr:hypothetical protein CFP56_00266 [Quercus suber]
MLPVHNAHRSYHVWATDASVHVSELTSIEHWWWKRNVSLTLRVEQSWPRSIHDVDGVRCGKDEAATRRTGRAALIIGVRVPLRRAVQVFREHSYQYPSNIGS